MTIPPKEILTLREISRKWEVAGSDQEIFNTFLDYCRLKTNPLEMKIKLKSTAIAISSFLQTDIETSEVVGNVGLKSCDKEVKEYLISKLPPSEDIYSDGSGYYYNHEFSSAPKYYLERRYENHIWDIGNKWLSIRSLCINFDDKDTIKLIGVIDPKDKQEIWVIYAAQPVNKTKVRLVDYGIKKPLDSFQVVREDLEKFEQLHEIKENSDIKDKAKDKGKRKVQIEIIKTLINLGKLHPTEDKTRQEVYKVLHQLNPDIFNLLGIDGVNKTFVEVNKLHEQEYGKKLIEFKLGTRK